MSSKAGLRSKKSGKSLRARRKVDYKKMHLGKTTDGSASTSTERDIGPSSDSDISLQEASASGNTSYKAPPTFTPVVPEKWLENEISDDEIDYDEHMAQMSAEMDSLDQEAKRLEKKAKFEAMTKELDTKRRKVSHLKGTEISDKSKIGTKTHDKSRHSSSIKKPASSKISKGNKSKTVNKPSDDININSLRNDEQLKSLVRKELKKLGLADADNFDSDTDSTCSSPSSSSDDDSTDNDSKSKKKEKKKKKSGINAKSSDKVKFPQEWPHTHLQYEHVNKQIKFQDLSFRLLIAGELEILSAEDLSTEERQGRLKLLKRFFIIVAVMNLRVSKHTMQLG